MRRAVLATIGVAIIVTGVSAGAAAQAEPDVRLVPVESPGFRLRLSPDGSRAAVFTDPFVLSDAEPDPDRLGVDVYDVATGELTASLEGPPDYASDVLFLPADAGLLVLHTNGTIARWDPARPAEPLATFQTYALGGDLLYVPDGRVLVRSSGFVMSLWDVESGAIESLIGRPFASRAEFQRVLDRRDFAFTGADVTPDGTAVATLLPSGEAFLYPFDGGAPALLRPPVDASEIAFFSHLSISPDGGSVAWFDSLEDGVVVRDMPPGATFVTTDAGPGYAFSPSGDRIAWLERGRGDDPHRLRIAPLEGGGEGVSVPLPLPPAPGALSSIEWAPDGRTLVVGGFVVEDEANGFVVITLG